MTDVLYALEIWLLATALFGWFFSRAAIRLRQPPPSVTELLLAAELRVDQRRPYEPAVFDADSLWRAVQIYERT